MSLFSGLASAARSSERMADVVRTEIKGPYVEVYRRLLLRALDSGAISADCASRIPILAEVIPAMSTHRLNTVGDAVHRNFFVSVVDDVVLAALGNPMS